MQGFALDGEKSARIHQPGSDSKRMVGELNK
jgi:hypothetical protein